MKLSWKSFTPTLLRLLSLSQVSFASTIARALSAGTSVRLVTGITIGIELGQSSSSQPHSLSLDETAFIQLAHHELTLPIMPLHLLGKKSWNVYNQDNISRVKRDEAAARAKEEAEEERMQEIDAERRLQILRGKRPSSIPLVEEVDNEDRSQRRSGDFGRERKKRKRFGEDDTDFELRLAHEQAKASASTENRIVLRKPVNDAPLTDRAGNINLFPQDSKFHVAKNLKAVEEAAREKKEFEDQYAMRFSNAAGFKQGLENPWYSKVAESSTIINETEMPRKDVWGDEDPRRKDRDAARITSNDPLAAMKQGAAKVRQVERERRQLKEEREELLELQREESRKRKRKRENDDDIKEFSLDKPEELAWHERNESRRRHKDSRRSHRHRSRDRDRSRHHHRY